MFGRKLKSAFVAVLALSASMAQAEPVYLLAQSQVTDADAFFNEYGPKAFASLQKYNATIHFGAQDFLVMEGDWDGNWTALISFPSEEQARAWYSSKDYTAAKPIRMGASEKPRLVLFRPVTFD